VKSQSYFDDKRYSAGGRGMTLVQVFDPPMCCSTGVCGLKLDPVLPRFSADLEWLKGQGLTVERFNLAQQPDAFVKNAVVRESLHTQGEKCLPLILVDGEVVAQGTYPPREELVVLAGMLPRDAGSLYTSAVEELVAIGTAIAANCESCFEYHFREARKLGVSRDDIALAVATARKVKEVAAAGMSKVAGRHLAGERTTKLPQAGPCCGPTLPVPSEKCC
jgi:AhpD family alkylhydroperoxidase